MARIPASGWGFSCETGSLAALPGDEEALRDLRGRTGRVGRSDEAGGEIEARVFEQSDDCVGFQAMEIQRDFLAEGLIEVQGVFAVVVHRGGTGSASARSTAAAGSTSGSWTSRHPAGSAVVPEAQPLRVVDQRSGVGSR
jgi:hypothetical protein